MASLASYAFQAAIILLIEYVVYKWLLSTSTFHCLNRGVIIACYLLALVLPAMSLPKPEVQAMTQAVFGPASQVKVLTPDGLSDSVRLIDFLPLVFVAGCLAAIVVTGMSFVHVALLCRLGEPKEAFGIRYAEVSAHLAPFSFMGRVVVPDGIDGDDLRLTLMHESVHAVKMHWADIVLAQLMVAFNWFNPAAYLFRRELKKIHEYEVDSAMMHTLDDPRSYQMLLIKTTVGKAFHSVANSLNHSQIKNRLTMMMKSKSRPARRLAVAALLPAVVVAVASFQTPVLASAISSIRNAQPGDVFNGKVNESSENLQNLGDEILFEADPVQVIAYTGAPAAKKIDVVDDPQVKPVYKGSDEAMYHAIAAKMVYPAEAVKNREQGRVTVQFVVLTDGTITDVSVLTSSGYAALDDEAVRVVGEALRKGWTPGKENGKPVNTRMCMPVVFKLQ